MALCAASHCGEKPERFDRDPGWEAINNRPVEPPVEIRQDFGWSPTSNAGGNAGEIGGYVTAAAEAAYYALPIPPKMFDDTLSASGVFVSPQGGYHLLVGFFNASTVNEWRTPNSIALRLSGRGDAFYAWVEYCTAQWRAGADSPQGFQTAPDPETGRRHQIAFEADAVYRWSLDYDPAGNNGAGTITARIGDLEAVCHLSPEHRAEGATMNRFGILNVTKSADDGSPFWMDELRVNSRAIDLSKDPEWEGLRNRATYTTTVVRPWFDFGWSPTRFAGGGSPGELGGVVFRGDCRYPERMASYADRVGPVSLDRPLRASGRLALVRGVTDSGVLIGFFDSRASMKSNPAQNNGLPMNFFGLSTDAPSREGFVLAPTYRLEGDHTGRVTPQSAPRIFPNGDSLAWSFDYDPDGHGRITVVANGRSIDLKLTEAARHSGVQFDRFGIVTTWIDGNSQTIYFDDVTYTSTQD